MALPWLYIMQRKLFLQLFLPPDSPPTALQGHMTLRQGPQVFAGKAVGYTRGGPIEHNLLSNCSTGMFLKYIPINEFAFFRFCSQGSYK
jgi:hypothetical protein